MLLQALAFAAVLALLGCAALDAALLSGRGAITRSAGSAVARELAHARQRLRDAVAARVAVGGTAAAAGAAFAGPPACADPGSCRLMVTDAGSVTGSTTAVAPANATAAALQEAGFVAEVRLAAQVTVSAAPPGGAPLASGAQLLTLRAFDAPPYAVVTGATDVRSDTSAAAEADTAGCTPGSDPSCVAGAAGGAPFADTRLHAAVCTAGPDGCVAGSLAEADGFGDRPWRNGNVDDSGWSR